MCVMVSAPPLSKQTHRFFEPTKRMRDIHPQPVLIPLGLPPAQSKPGPAVADPVKRADGSCNQTWVSKKGVDHTGAELDPPGLHGDGAEHRHRIPAIGVLTYPEGVKPGFISPTRRFNGFQSGLMGMLRRRPGVRSNAYR